MKKKIKIWSIHIGLSHHFIPEICLSRHTENIDDTLDRVIELTRLLQGNERSHHQYLDDQHTVSEDIHREHRTFILGSSTTLTQEEMNQLYMEDRMIAGAEAFETAIELYRGV